MPHVGIVIMAIDSYQNAKIPSWDKACNLRLKDWSCDCKTNVILALLSIEITCNKVERLWQVYQHEKFFWELSNNHNLFRSENATAFIVFVISPPTGPEWRREHWQVIPGPSSARQTVSDFTACLATCGLEPERRRYTCHQLWPAVCSSQARTWSVLSYKLNKHTMSIMYCVCNTVETVYNEGIKNLIIKSLFEPLIQTGSHFTLLSGVL